jgi:hypothetical protein
MRQLTVPLLKELQEKLPEIFSDIKCEWNKFFIRMWFNE